MELNHFNGPLIRMLRLQKNWSQETLAHGICSVSYLSKIEQGKVELNVPLISALFEKLNVAWNDSVSIYKLRDNLYESIFSLDDKYTRFLFAQLEEIWPEQAIGPCYADFIIIRAYHLRQPAWNPTDFVPLLDKHQNALFLILQNRYMDAYRIYPCALTAFSVAEEAYHVGNFTKALEYLQNASEQASQKGYVYLHMYAEHYMVNCYSDMGNLDAMYRHSVIAERLGRVLNEDKLVRTIQYNIAATKAEFRDYTGSYEYFSNLDEQDLMDLHKLAICCEALDKLDEARAAVNDFHESVLF